MNTIFFTFFAVRMYVKFYDGQNTERLLMVAC
jgi:hypothetical protein